MVRASSNKKDVDIGPLKPMSERFLQENHPCVMLINLMQNF